MAKTKQKPKSAARRSGDQLPIEVKLREARARFELQALRGAAKAQKAMLAVYAAADRGRRNKDWRAPNVSADAAIIPDLPVLCARVRSKPHPEQLCVLAIGWCRVAHVGNEQQRLGHPFGHYAVVFVEHRVQRVQIEHHIFGLHESGVGSEWQHQ